MNPNFIDEVKGDGTAKPFGLRNFTFNKKADLFLHFLICAVVIFFGIRAGISNASNKTIEDFGIQFQQLGSGGGSMFFDEAGDPHWFVGYTGRGQFWDINLNTGLTRYFNTGKSGIASGPGKAIWKNKFYIVLGDTCSVWEYDITAGSFTEIKQTGASNGCGNSTGAQSAYTTNDGMIYFGTAHRATVYELNPETSTIRDFGIIDPPTGNPTCAGCPSRQVASIAADANYVYTGMRDTGTNSYWLAILNRTDGSLSASCWKDDRVNSALVASSTDGKEIWYSTNNGYYRLDTTNGTCPTTPATPPSLKPWFYRSNVYLPEGDSYAKASSVFGVEIDATSIDVDTSTGGIATLKYRKPAGAGAWVEKTQSISMKDAQIKRIKAKDDNSAYLISGSYGPNSIFNGNSSSVLGRTPQSTYAVTPLGQYVYLSGYTANTFRYNPALPWTVMGTSTQTFCNVSSPSNPCVAFQGMGKYHYYSKAASNGNLYIASDYKRGARAGGDIGWINPSTGATGSYAFTCDAPSGFALLSDSKTLAYAGSGEAGSFGCTNTVGKVYIFDTNTNTVTNSFSPLINSDSQGTIIETNDGGILGIVKGYPASGQYTMYKVDASGTHASWSPMTVTGSIFGPSNGADQYFIKARDGMIYTTGNTNEVIKINPTDGSRTSFLTANSYITTMEFVGDDLYMAVGSNDSKLQRVKGVNPAPVPDPVLASDRSITAFDFDALSPKVKGSVNEVLRTIALSVPFNTSVNSLVPTISISGKSINPNTGVAQDFTNPVTYTVTAEDLKTQQYTVTVTVEPDTTKKEEVKQEVKQEEVKKEEVKQEVKQEIKQETPVDNSVKNTQNQLVENKTNNPLNNLVNKVDKKLSSSNSKTTSGSVFKSSNPVTKLIKGPVKITPKTNPVAGSLIDKNLSESPAKTIIANRPQVIVNGVVKNSRPNIVATANEPVINTTSSNFVTSDFTAQNNVNTINTTNQNIEVVPTTNTNEKSVIEQWEKSQEDITSDLATNIIEPDIPSTNDALNNIDSVSTNTPAKQTATVKIYNEVKSIATKAIEASASFVLFLIEKTF